MRTYEEIRKCVKENLDEYIPIYIKETEEVETLMDVLKKETEEQDILLTDYVFETKPKISLVHKKSGDEQIIVDSKNVFNQLRDRAGNNASIHKVMEDEDLRKHMNLAMKYSKNPCKLIKRCGIVIAMHSDQYSVLKQPEVYKHAKTFLDSEFPNHSLKTATYNLDQTAIYYSLEEDFNNNDVFNNYKTMCKKSLFNHYNLDKAVPLLSVKMGDTGKQSVAIEGYIYIPDSQSIFPIMFPIRVKHQGKNDMELVKKSLEKGHASFNKNLEILTSLCNVVMTHPKAAFVAAIETLKLDKLCYKAARDAVNEFKLNCENANTITAHNLFCYLTTIVNGEQFYRLKNERTKLSINMAISSAVMMNWHLLDREGPESLR